MSHRQSVPNKAHGAPRNVRSAVSGPRTGWAGSNATYPTAQRACRERVSRPLWTPLLGTQSSASAACSYTCSSVGPVPKGALFRVARYGAAGQWSGSLSLRIAHISLSCLSSKTPLLGQAVAGREARSRVTARAAGLLTRQQTRIRCIVGRATKPRAGGTSESARTEVAYPTSDAAPVRSGTKRTRPKSAFASRGPSAEGGVAGYRSWAWPELRLQQRYRGACSPISLVLALLASAYHLAAAAAFSAAGTLAYDVLGHPPVLHNEFHVSVSNCLWHVTMVLPEPNDFISLDYHFDGTNTLEYGIFKRLGPDVGSGTVEPGPVPRTETSAAGEYIWLAYASGCYFARLPQGGALSFSVLHSRHGLSRRYQVPADWNLAQTAPNLPTAVIYYETNIAGLGEDGKPFSIPLPGSLRPRYPAGEFKVMSWASFRGLEVPREFEYIARGFRERGGTGAVLATNVIVRGTLTNVSSFDGFPELPDTLHLQDFRVPEPSVVYRTTNGTLPGVESGFMQGTRQRAARRFADRLRVSKALVAGRLAVRRRIALIAIFAIALAPLAVFLHGRLGRRTVSRTDGITP